MAHEYLRNLIFAKLSAVFIFLCHDKFRIQRNVKCSIHFTNSNIFLPGVMKTGLANVHFVIFPNFPCLIAWHVFTVLLAYVVFLFLLVLCLGICVEVDVDRITILLSPPSPLSIFCATHNSFLTQVTVIWNQRVSHQWVDIFANPVFKNPGILVCLIWLCLSRRSAISSL